MRVHLRTISIEGFRSCERTTFSPNRHLSVLVGPNGAGKTNVLQAIMLLGASAQPIRMYRRTESAVSQCRMVADFKIGKSDLELRSTIGYLFDENNKETIADITEELRASGLKTPKSREGQWQPVPPEFYRMHQLALFNHMEPRRLLKSGGFPSQLRSKLLRAFAFRNGISYYSASKFTNPSRCPSSIEIDEDIDLVRHTPQRHEHQRFLLDLYRTREKNQAKYLFFMSLVGKQGLRLVTQINWKKVKVASSQVEVRTGGKILKRNRQRLLIVPSVRIGDDRLSFSQLSEGTFKTLALIFYLLTDSSELLLIEEPEVCVHQGLLASIIELIKGQADEKQIIFSTHSDLVLDQLEPDQVFSVMRHERKGTMVRSLATGYPRRTINVLREFLRTSGNLGEFWRQGGLDT